MVYGSEKINIIVFDGGGVRGALSSELMKRISEVNTSVLDKTNLFGGTSTGSYISAALAYGISIEKIADEIYSYENIKYLFTPSYSNYLRPKYDNAHLIERMKSYFPEDLKLNDLKKYVIIPAYYLGDINQPWQPVIYSNLPGSTNGDTKVVDVLMRSSAAPAFFPEYDHYIDGGVALMNPSIACVSNVVEYLGTNLADINMLSMGTGNYGNRLLESTRSWGEFQWIEATRLTVSEQNIPNPILNICLESNGIVSDKITSQLLGQRFFKLNPYIDKYVPLDDYNDIPYLKSVADNYDLKPTLAWLNSYWN